MLYNFDFSEASSESPKKRSLGLAPKRAGDLFEGVIYRHFGVPAYIEEGQETFEALVPNRFKI